MEQQLQQDRQSGAAAAIGARCDAAMPAPHLVAELLAGSAAIDAAEARWLTFAAAEYQRGRAEAEAEHQAAAADDYAAGYARCAADVKAAEHGAYDAIADWAEAERFRWIVRGEVRTRATFGEPHQGDYPGGPVAWPELPEVVEHQAAELAGAA